jgi:uncharacterized membrane protein (UPF0127 family)
MRIGTAMLIALTASVPAALVAPAPLLAVPLVRLPVGFHPTIGVTVETQGGARLFQVEVARTPDEQERGLKFRRSLPENGGMIFPIDPVTIASFWMKNTPIALDILFIRPDGSIASLHERALPYSTDIIDSGEPVGAVLEIPGGSAAALGIHRGDKVRWQEALGAL